MPKPKGRSASIISQESYSTVMIADVAADVPVSIETQEPVKTAKEASNLAYDNHGEMTSPTVDRMTQRSNGVGISKGVLLNAVQFGQNDSKTKTDEKPIQLSTSLPVPTLTQPISEPKGFKDMSFTRKIAFGFSFLPSVLFVLCFAIILPCNVPKSCIEEVWSTQINDTEATSGLEIHQNIAFTALKQGKSVLLQLDKNNGKSNEVKLAANSPYIKCGKIMNEKETDCIVMDEYGKIYSYNDSHSEMLWDPISEEDEQPSNPIILTGCMGKTDDIALAVSSRNMKVFYTENKESNFTISDCDSVPDKLMPWMINGSSNIVFICEKDKKDHLISVPKNVWCTYSKNPQEKPIILKSGPLQSLKNSTIQPLNDGVVLWTGTEASMILPNGLYLWKAFNLSLPEENRFILYGNFEGENKQIAFLSSNLQSGLKITLLDPSDGSFIKSISHLNVEATEIIHVQGKKKDYVLLLLKKITKGIVTSTLSQINDISTTIVSLVSNEEVSHAIQGSISEELAIIDLDGSMESIMIKRDLKDEAYKSTIAAVSDNDAGVLSIYFLSTSDQSQMKITEIRNINVANWDKSIKSKCKI